MLTDGVEVGGGGGRLQSSRERADEKRGEMEREESSHGSEDSLHVRGYSLRRGDGSVVEERHHLIG